MRLLRSRVLEDDHRPDRLRSLDVRDVETLDPEREALQVEALAQFLERLDPPQPLLLGLVALGLQRQRGVLRRQLL